MNPLGIASNLPILLIITLSSPTAAQLQHPFHPHHQHLQHHLAPAPPDAASSDPNIPTDSHKQQQQVISMQPPPRLVSLTWSTLFGSLFVLLTIVGLFGNTIVVLAISGERKMRKSVMNLLLLNLAIADALNLVTTTVEWTPTVVLGYPAWVFPALLCPIGGSLVNALVSSLSNEVKI